MRDHQTAIMMKHYAEYKKKYQKKAPDPEHKIGEKVKRNFLDDLNKMNQWAQFRRKKSRSTVVFPQENTKMSN